MSFWTDLLKWIFGSKPAPAPTPAPVPPITTSPPAPTPPPEGKKRLYSVTINAYPGAALQGCLNDGKNMAAYLSPKGFEVHRLIDGEATGPAMEAFWREAVRTTKDGDVTVLHDSGHGSNGPSGLPTDPGQCMVSVDMRPFYASRLGRVLDEEYTGGTIIIMLDCCHSETGSRLIGEPSGRYRQAKSIPWEMLDTSQDVIPSYREARKYSLAALARSPSNGIVEFAACQANDVTWDAKIGDEVQGCATRAWIDSGTELDASDVGRYTVLEFQNKVRTKLPNEEFPNKPQLQASIDQQDQFMWRP